MHDQVDLDPNGQAPPMNDLTICSILEQHLGIKDAMSHFKKMDDDAKAKSMPSQKKGLRSSASPSSSSQAQPSLEAFVALTRDLLEMEREAEVQQAQEFTLLRSPETAQVLNFHTTAQHVSPSN